MRIVFVLFAVCTQPTTQRRYSPPLTWPVPHAFSDEPALGCASWPAYAFASSQCAVWCSGLSARCGLKKHLEFLHETFLPHLQIHCIETVKQHNTVPVFMLNFCFNYVMDIVRSIPDTPNVNCIGNLRNRLTTKANMNKIQPLVLM